MEKPPGALQLKVLLLVESGKAEVTVCRRLPEGGFTTELHDGQDAVISLTEIGTSLALAELYENVDFTTAMPEDEAVA